MALKSELASAISRVLNTPRQPDICNTTTVNQHTRMVTITVKVNVPGANEFSRTASSNAAAIALLRRDLAPVLTAESNAAGKSAVRFHLGLSPAVAPLRLPQVDVIRQSFKPFRKMLHQHRVEGSGHLIAKFYDTLDQLESHYIEQMGGGM